MLRTATIVFGPLFMLSCVATMQPAAAQSHPDSAASPSAKKITVAILPVMGAPEGGSLALTKAMERALAKRGLTVAAPEKAQYCLAGKVETKPGADGQESMTIEWVALDTAGKPFKYAVAGQRQIAAGSLGKVWGTVADEAADAVSANIAELLEMPWVPSAEIPEQNPEELEKAYIQTQQRLREEAKAVLGLIVRDLTNEVGAQQCLIDRKWMNYPLPENDASRYFGVSVHASLTVNGPQIGMEEVIDVPGMKSALCSSEEWKAYSSELRKAEPEGSPKNGPSYTGLSFPIFDRDFRKAAVAVEYIKYTPALVPLDGSTNVHIYSKTNGWWHKLVVVNYGRFPE